MLVPGATVWLDVGSLGGGIILIVVRMFLCFHYMKSQKHIFSI